MAGIYLHIPFCKQACHYCDFHFSTNLTYIDKMHAAILDELTMQKAFLGAETIETIYFGGGTPSLLSINQIAAILERIGSNFRLAENIEVTLEANPDDLGRSQLQDLKLAGINRLSLGIQSFDENRLKFINRAHTAQEAITIIESALNSGFKNITADLIYAIPPEDMDYWKKDLNTMINFGLPHISLYGLTIEERTVFGKWAAKGKITETSESIAAQQYEYAIETLTQNGFLHYEVSNFAKPGFESRHNLAYWKGIPYLGVGPGAHSFDGDHRYANIRHNHHYIKAIQSGVLPNEKEELSTIEKLNETILIRLRTAEGLDSQQLSDRYHIDFVKDKKSILNNLITNKLLKTDQEHFSLTPKGFMVADEIALQLFYE